MKGQILIITLCTLLIAVPVIAQSGGGFEITEAVISNAGGSASNGDFDVDATVGQSASGDTIGSGIFSVTGGFWNYTSLVPTAAHVSVSGRVLAPNGSGVAYATVYLQTQDGTFLITRSSSFGHYMFEGIPAGQTAFISVESRRYIYASRTVMLDDIVTNFDFTPEP